MSLKKFPSDSFIKFHIQNVIRNVSDVSTLTKKSIKDSIATRFDLSSKDRKRLDEDEHLKSIINVYIKEAIDELPDDEVDSPANGQTITPEAKKYIEKKKNESPMPDVDMDQPLSSQQSISEKIKNGTASASKNENGKGSDLKRKPESNSNLKKPSKVPQKDDKMNKQKEREATLSEFSSLEDSDDEKKKKKKKKKKKQKEKSQTRPKKAHSSTSSTNGDSNLKKRSSIVTKDEPEKLEAKMKKLKKLVALCGTRRVWKRLYEEAGCADPDADEEEEGKVKIHKLKKQIEVIEDALKEVGMTAPFTQAKADAIREKKELEDDLQVIQKANMTEKSKTRSSKSGRSHRSGTPVNVNPEDDESDADKPPPPLKKFRNDLASFADELNN